jgi:hypothetical protein
MATEALPDEKWYHGQGSALRVVEEAGALMTTKTLEQARRESDPVTEFDYINWLSTHRRVGDIFTFKTRRGEAYILSW